MLDSPYSRRLDARTAILGRYGDTWFQVRSLGRSSRPRSQHQTPPFGFSFPPPGPAGPVPRLHRYYEGAATSSRPSRRASLPSLGGTSVALARFRSSTAECTVEAWSWSPGISIREFPRKRAGSPKFLGNLDCPSARVLTDAGRTACTRPLRCSSVAPGPPGAKAPTKGLSTPNSMAFGLAVYASQGGLLRPTQDSLPVAGQALPDGLSTHKIPLRGFKIVSLHLYPPLPSFAWRYGGDPGHKDAGDGCRYGVVPG
jgi:hypothetical protein